MLIKSHGFSLHEQCLVTIEGETRPARISEFLAFPQGNDPAHPDQLDCVEVIINDISVIVPIDDAHLRHATASRVSR
jgi:hypothetical protein